MANEIVESQNLDLAIDKLAAQRELYSKAKVVFNIRAFSSLFIAIVGPLLISNFKDWGAYIAFVSIVYILIDLLLFEMIEKNNRENAAKIQESLDMELFGLDWNNIVAGNKPEEELIYKNSKVFKEKNDTSSLQDWYPKSVGSLDILPATLVCQRSSIWWDVDLRKVYISVLYGALLLFSLLAVFLAIVKDLKVQDILLILLPLMPLYRILINQIKSQHSTIKKTSGLKIDIERLIEGVVTNGINEATLKTDIRRIQDELYRHRKSCFPLPDWLYKIFRKSQEEQMGYNADVHVGKLVRSLGGR